MDFGMPFAQKQAWNNVKDAVDSYVELTGSDIAVVTKFNEAPQFSDGPGDDPLFTKSSLALHGHGHLLLQVRQCLDQIQNQFGKQGGKENRAPTQIGIPAPQRNTNFHNQSIARSLTSSFQSLKLDDNSHGWKSHAENRRKEKLTRKSQSTLPKNRDLAELDESLLFEEESHEEECKDSSDSDIEDDDDFDSDDYSDMCRDNAIIRPRGNDFHRDPSKSGTSLPVNINMNYMTRSAVRPDIPQMRYQNVSTARQENFVDDTPNPSKMMASIQALARSVTKDSTQIFGDRPRPNVFNQKFA